MTQPIERDAIYRWRRFSAETIELRAFSSEDLLYRRVFESQEFLAWARGSSQLVLHLDSKPFTIDRRLSRSSRDLIESRLARTGPIERAC